MVGPAFSRDGSHVAWWQADEPAAPRVFLGRSDGKGSTVAVGPGREPAWSPTRAELAFSSGVSPDLYRLLGIDPSQAPRGDVFVYDVPGRTLRNLTHGAGNNTAPALSPDGNWIAFISDRDDARGEVYLMRADGSNVRRLTNNDFAETFLAWAPPRGRRE